MGPGLTFAAGRAQIAVWVIGNGKFPEGVKVKSVVERVKISYDDMPIVRFPCKNNRSGSCERHDIAVEDAMQQVMNQMRKYSMIQARPPPEVAAVAVAAVVVAADSGSTR